MTATAQRELCYLLVEDNDDHAELIERCFRFGNIPCEIRRVRSGADCLAYLAGDNAFAERTEYPYPDVVLMDIRMPGILDGLHTLQAIRSDPRHRCLSVMMLTSSDRNNDVVRAYELGANGYVVKSDDTNEMIDTLRQVQQSFGTVQRLPARASVAEPWRQPAVPIAELPSATAAEFLQADQETAYAQMLAAYRRDPNEMQCMLKVLERSSTTRYASLLSRFCLEQRQLYAGGKDVDWPFIQRVVMDKLPQYEEVHRMAGIVAAISAELEGNEWASGDHPYCQVWRGFSTAYLKQRWENQTADRSSPRRSAWKSIQLWSTVVIGIAIIAASAIAAYALLDSARQPGHDQIRNAFILRSVASIAPPGGN